MPKPAKNEVRRSDIVNGMLTTNTARIHAALYLLIAISLVLLPIAFFLLLLNEASGTELFLIILFAFSLCVPSLIFFAILCRCIAKGKQIKKGKNTIELLHAKKTTEIKNNRQ